MSNRIRLGSGRTRVAVRTVLVVLIAVIAQLLVGAAGAREIELSLRLEVITVDGPLTAIARGDRFQMDMTVEDGRIDFLIGSRGSFGQLVTDLSLSRSDTNAGLWDPNGTYQPLGSSFSTDSLAESLVFALRGSDFPEGGSELAFREVYLEASWAPGITDSGVQDTFADQLGPEPFGLNGMAQRIVEFRFLDGPVFRTALLEVTSISAIVPDDFTTISEAVSAVEDDGLPGKVIIRSDGPFNEFVNVGESVTIEAAPGFSPLVHPVGGAGFTSTLSIRASTDADTSVVARGLALRTGDASGSQAVAINNRSSTHRLDVVLEQIEAYVEQGTAGVRIGAGSGDTNVTVLDSFIEVEGQTAGASSGIHIGPIGYAVDLTLLRNTIRSSRASGLRIFAGVDAPVTAVIDGNLFQGFETPSGQGRAGLFLSGQNLPGSIETDLVATNNVFDRMEHGLYVNSQASSLHRVKFNNNTVVDSHSTGILAAGFGTSSIDLRHSNNIVVGSGGTGHTLEANGSYIIDGGSNLYFDNAEGPFGEQTFAHPGDLFVDPHFVDRDFGDYRLLSTSDAVDAGIEAPAGGLGFGTDFHGRSRIEDGDGDGFPFVDIGALELPVPEPSIALGLASGVLGLLAAGRPKRSGRRGCTGPSRAKRETARGFLRVDSVDPVGPGLEESSVRRFSPLRGGATHTDHRIARHRRHAPGIGDR